MNEKIRSLQIAIFAAGFLALMKGVAGFLCYSSSLVASALDSLMDMGVSGINFLSVKKGSQPPDEDHAYGHEKIESLASYSQGLVVLLGSLAILTKGIWDRGAGTVTHSGMALAVILVSAAVNFVVTFYLSRAERATGSLILKAEKAHYITDFISYVFIFAVLLLVKVTGWEGWDLIGAVILAVYIGVLAGKILVQAGNELVDRALPPSALEDIDHIIRRQSEVRDYHQLRTRRVGSKIFIDMHLVLPRDKSFEEAHEITESLIQKIRAKFGDADVTIHEDPEGGS